MMSARLQRSGPALLVIALHVVVIYTLMVTLGVVKAPSIVKPSTVVFVPEATEQKQEPVQIEKPKIAEPDVTVPVPEVAPELPPVENVVQTQSQPDASTAPS